jgi:hypothetical protein
MKSIQEDLVIHSGSSFKKTFSLIQEDNSPVDLTSYTGRCDVKLHLASIHVMFSGIVLPDANPKTGKFDLIIPASETKKLCFTDAFYMIIFSNPLGDIIKPYFGQITVVRI